MTFKKNELCRFAGYSYHRLHDIDKTLPKDKKLFVQSEDGKYDLSMFIQRWVEYNVSLANGSTEMSLEEAKTEHEIVKKRKTELEVQRMEGSLVELETVMHLWKDVITSFRQRLLNLSTRCAALIVEPERAEYASSVIDGMIRKELESISETPLPSWAEETTTEDEEE